ncbi:hypothetical protein AVEN_121559-1 [Araneus ventricosus]|uniref:Uncharacterized protein n=1 Tax=Araneus ventricosus TaxID=182803 RepID=A0A4Y2GLH2_ARAVE|nr:hypothetical protein AVEN_121559-1 [Araneus ventricosus]
MCYHLESGIGRRKAVEFEENLQIISEIDQESKQVDAATWNFSVDDSYFPEKKRKDIGDVVKKSEVDSKGKIFKGAVNDDADEVFN